MEAVSASKTSVNVYQTSRPSIPQVMFITVAVRTRSLTKREHYICIAETFRKRPHVWLDPLGVSVTEIVATRSLTWVTCRGLGCNGGPSVNAVPYKHVIWWATWPSRRELWRQAGSGWRAVSSSSSYVNTRARVWAETRRVAHTVGHIDKWRFSAQQISDRLGLFASDITSRCPVCSPRSLDVLTDMKPKVNYSSHKSVM
jgi:hypothetical protein